MPDEKEPANTPDEWGLAMLAEAEECAEFIAKRNRLGVRVVRALVESGYTTSPFGSVEATPKNIEENRQRVETLVKLFRDMRAMLRGAEDDRAFEERTLVYAVRHASPDGRSHLASLAHSRSWEMGKEKRFDVETLDGAVEAVFAIAENEMSPGTFATLSSPKNRDHVRRAVAYRGEFQRAPRGRESAAPRWLEPLFLAALNVGIVPGEPGNAGGWYQSLLRRGVLAKERGKTR